MFHDFSQILPLFGLSRLEIELPARQLIDPETGYSTGAAPRVTKEIMAVVFPAESWAESASGAQLLPTGAFKAGDFLVFVATPVKTTSGEEISLELYGEGQLGTVFIINGKRYGAAKMLDFADSGRFQVWLASARPIEDIA